MEKIASILSKLQQTLKTPKDRSNDFGGYEYRSAEDILEKAKPHLPEGVFISLNDEIIQVGDRIYVKSTATISNGVESISCTSNAREEESKKKSDASQLTGSATSYARKYALGGLMAIDNNKDADALNTHGATDDEVIQKAIKDTEEEAAKEFVAYMECVDKNWDSLNSFKEAIANGDAMTAYTVWSDIPKEDQYTIYKRAPTTKGSALNTEQRNFMKSNEWSAARKELYGDKS